MVSWKREGWDAGEKGRNEGGKRKGDNPTRIFSRMLHGFMRDRGVPRATKVEMKNPQKSPDAMRNPKSSAPREDRIREKKRPGATQPNNEGRGIGIVTTSSCL